MTQRWWPTALLVLVLPGCKRPAQWTRDNLAQVSRTCEGCGPCSLDIVDYRLYEQFTTIVRLAALYVDEQVDRLYWDCVAARQGWTDAIRDEQKKAAADRGAPTTRLLVVMSPDDEDQILRMKKEQKGWTVLLCQGGETFAVRELKRVEEDPVWKNFFGRRWTRFAALYDVRFEGSIDPSEPFTAIFNNGIFIARLEMNSCVQ
jgi:hypothetical protein